MIERLRRSVIARFAAVSSPRRPGRAHGRAAPLSTTRKWPSSGRSVSVGPGRDHGVIIVTEKTCDNIKEILCCRTRLHGHGSNRSTCVLMPPRLTKPNDQLRPPVARSSQLPNNPRPCDGFADRAHRRTHSSAGTGSAVCRKVSYVMPQFSRTRAHQWCLEDLDGAPSCAANNLYIASFLPKNRLLTYCSRQPGHEHLCSSNRWHHHAKTECCEGASILSTMERQCN